MLHPVGSYTRNKMCRVDAAQHHQVGQDVPECNCHMMGKGANLDLPPVLPPDVKDIHPPSLTEVIKREVPFPIGPPSPKHVPSPVGSPPKEDLKLSVKASIGRRPAGVVCPERNVFGMPSDTGLFQKKKYLPGVAKIRAVTPPPALPTMPTFTPQVDLIDSSSLLNTPAMANVPMEMNTGFMPSPTKLSRASLSQYIGELLCTTTCCSNRDLNMMAPLSS